MAQILHGVVFERDIRHHLLEASVFFFKLPHLFDVGNVHATEFRFPSVDFVVSVVNPSRIKGFAQSDMRRSKTDKIGAKIIARFSRAQAPMA